MYQVQCLNGHVYNAPVGSDLERRCIEHETKGFIDALILHPDDCSSCIVESDPIFLDDEDPLPPEVLTLLVELYDDPPVGQEIGGEEDGWDDVENEDNNW